MDAVVTIIVAMVGASAGFLASYVALRQQKASAAATTFDEALALLKLHKQETEEARMKVAKHEKRIAELEGRVASLESEVADYVTKTDNLRLGVRILQRQLKEFGVKPDWSLKQ